MIYRWRMREDGVVMIEESPGQAERAPMLAPELVEGTSRIPGMLGVIERWEPLAEKVSAVFAIPRGWILAMIWRESGGNPRAFRREPNGWTGIGLLQPTSTGVKGGLSDEALYDPETNLLCGARYIALLMRRYGHDFPKVAAAFNHGHVEASTSNPWGMVQTAGHVSSEVAALNYYLLRDERMAAERAAALQFSAIDLLGPNFDSIDPVVQDADELSPSARGPKA